jgi:hypothetical protein
MKYVGYASLISEKPLKTSEKRQMAACFNCGRSEDDFPVIVLRLAGHESHVCPQCLPALIHHPDRLTEKLIAAGWQNGTTPSEEHSEQ